MKGFREQDTLPYPTFKDVYEHVRPEDIYSMYFGKPIVLGVVNSNIGANDRHASLSFFYSTRYNTIKFKEHRYGYSGDAIDYTQIVCGYTTARDSCMRIMRDFNIQGYRISKKIYSLPAPGKVTTGTIVNKQRGEIDIQIQPREWEDYDLRYWAQYGISKEWLKKGMVFPLKHYFINGNTRYPEKYSYAYAENKDGMLTYKIYQPFADRKRKWINNSNASVWDLWHLLPKTFPYLIITKSRKDALSIMSTMNIPSTSFQSEGTLPKPQVMDEINSRFKHVWILYDNDFDKETNYGMEYSKQLAETFNLRTFMIPDKYKSKDYTDLVANVGIVDAKAILKSLILKDLKKLKK